MENEKRPVLLDDDANGRVIALPANFDQSRRDRLVAKLAEYKTRVNQYSPPEADLDTFYKISVLQAVLETGSVSTVALCDKLIAQCGRVDARVFSNACAVIEDYIMTGGRKVRDSSRPFESIPVE